MISEEDLKEDVDDLNDNEITLLSILQNTPTKTTRIQKLGIFVDRIMYDRSPDSAGAYHYGGFSDNLDDAIESMKSDGAIVATANGFQLTEYGQRIYEEAKKKETIKAKIETVDEIKSFFDSLSDQQLLKLSYIFYPDTTEESLIKDRIKTDGNTFQIDDLEIITGLSKEEAIERLKKSKRC